MLRYVAASVATLGCIFAVGCASPNTETNDGADVSVATNDVDERAAYYNGTWTIDAWLTTSSTLDASMAMSGPMGQTTPAGLCILRRMKSNGSPIPCSGDDANGDAECGGGNGQYRCLRADNEGIAYCYTRQACRSGTWGNGIHSVSTSGVSGEVYIANGCFGNNCSGGRTTSYAVVF